MYRLSIFGPPRTKKNSARIVRAGQRMRILPSVAHQAWAKSAVEQLQHAWRLPPLDAPVSVAATVYRERGVGDLVNYLQAIADALEKAGVVINDRQIVSWDGSRL